MIILGIHDGHNSGACIFKDGKLLIALSEERITRNKNEYGFPKESIKLCLKKCSINRKQIDFVSVSTKYLPPKYFITKRNTSFSIEDYKIEQNKYWYPKLYKKKKLSYLKIFSNKIQKKNKIFYNLSKIKDEDDVIAMQKSRLDGISNYLKISSKKIYFFDHHMCHAYYGYYGCEFDKIKTAVVTADGGGDNKNCSIWITKNKKLKQVYSSNLGNIGRMYRYATLNMNMKPTEHEFKVMGLAGYNLPSHFNKKILEIYKNTLDVKNCKFFYKKKIKDHYFYFKEKFQNYRFDSQAYGIQKFTEDILTKWFLQISKKYKVRNFIFSGGVAQNIKATKIISEQKEIKKIFVPPGPGDESLSIGSAYCLLEKFGFEKKDISNLSNPYIGINYSDNDLLFLKKIKKIKFKKTTLKDVAKILAKGQVVARFSLNNSEFGPRALGNRSIIASPFSSDTIHYINKSIKVRDFWMPFAPSVISDDFSRFFKNINKSFHYFMTSSVETKELGKKYLSGGIHPFDKTARPQLVLKKYNKDYYNLIKEFKRITGVGALLNTSFNIHGEPIVHSPRDAVKSFFKSDLKYLYMGNFLIQKKN